MFRFAWIILLSAQMTDALSLRCIYICVVKYCISFCLKMTFGNKVENLHSQPASCFESYIEFSICLVFSEFLFYFIFLNCRLVMFFFVFFLLDTFLLQFM
jgi:hypothetical protein